MRQFTSSDGLPSNTVNDMLQDDEGFMWFATDEGVSRFDGHHFYNFRKPDGIADDDVIRLGKDQEGRIWFLGFNGKASFYAHGKFYDESNSKVAAQTQLGSAYSKFMISGKGTVYLVSNTDGFIQVNGDEVKNYSRENLLRQGIVFSNGYKGVKMDTSGSLWIFSKDSIYILKEGHQVVSWSRDVFPRDLIEGSFLSDGATVIPRNGKLVRIAGAKTDSTGDLGIQVITDYVSIEEDG
ncbi:MAG TPA: two-component regulator propeller domain-containing protein, partial [Chitinophagales bacterium]|nr:two-component regulator propeller domain-containing protein [Chitinophagales bacterium]